MIKCENCNATGFDPVEQGEPCEVCGGYGNFLSQGEVRFEDIENWQWLRFDGVVLLKVNGSMAVNSSGELGEFYASDIVEPLPELSGIVKLVVDSYQRSK